MAQKDTIYLAQVCFFLSVIKSKQVMQISPLYYKKNLSKFTCQLRKKSTDRNTEIIYQMLKCIKQVHQQNSAKNKLLN